MPNSACSFKQCDNVILAVLFALAVLAPSLAWAPPGPPPTPVPAENLFTEYAAGMGMAGYGAWVLFRSKRASKRKNKNEEAGQ